MTDVPGTDDEPDGGAPVGDPLGERGGDPVEEKVGKGVAHLQAAARELIAAARSALDAAEELVEDPRMADTVTGLLRSVVPPRRPVPGTETDTAEGGGSPVQRIDVT
jgi:hypothetical protein